METIAFNILVVDDEAITRRSLADILRLEGYQVKTANSGDEAVQLLPTQTFDLIFLDLKMQGMSGLEVMRWVKENYPEIQMVMLTAHGSLESAIEALRQGAQDYLLKPASPQQIIACASKARQNRDERKQRRALLSQIEATVRVLKGPREDQKAVPLFTPGTLIGNGLMVDLNRRLIWKDELQVQLTPTEGKLLQTFLEMPRYVFSHRELIHKVHGFDTTTREATEILRPLISRLRRKLSRFPGGENWISSVRSTGYVFDQPE